MHPWAERSLAPALGTRLSPYEVLTVIGTGGMGEVYRARDQRVGRDAAVKVSSEQFPDGSRARSKPSPIARLPESRTPKIREYFPFPQGLR